MAHREFAVTLPSDVAERLAAGDDVSDYVRDAIGHQVRREAILAYLNDCEQAGHAPLNDQDLDDFRQAVGGDLTKYHLVYDTAALVGHAAGRSRRVRAGLRLIVDEPEIRIRVPLACLLEAYAQVPREAGHVLDELATNPGVAIVPVGPDPRTAVTVGQLAIETGGAGAAHAAHVAMEGQGPAVVFTDATMPTEVLARPV